MSESSAPSRRAMTVYLEPDLAAAITAERQRIEAQTGLRVSKSKIVTRALRAGLKLPD